MRLLVLATALTCAACAWTQTIASLTAADPTPAGIASDSIHGVVTSADGTVYEGAQVQLQLGATGSAPPATQQTDSGGAFNFASLPPGPFKLSVTSNGFGTQVMSGVLHAGEAFDAHNIVLSLAAANSEVRVSAGSQAEIAQEQLYFEEKQRVLGVFPNYYVSYVRNPVPLTARQKYQLAWRMSIDPVTWVMTGTIAGMEQAKNSFAGYGLGAQGYGKRFGANYADTFSSTMIGGAILPAALKQDPRYFFKGTGSTGSRVLYAIANSVICKGDNDRWQPNYSAVLGALAAGGISNLYYPKSNRSSGQIVVNNALLGTAVGAAQNMFQEFVVRRLTPRLPNYSANAQ